MSFTKHVWLPICSQLSTRTAYRNTERPYINFFCCFIDANFWNEVEGKRFVIRDDIPHVAVGYAGLSISKLKKDCLSITPQFVASVDTKKKLKFPHIKCIQNKYPFKWLKKESYCMQFNFISKKDVFSSIHL